MLLDGLRDELAELEVSIAHHRSCLQELESRKAAVQEQLAAYAYPILTLPLEIGSEIFLQCLPEDGVDPIPSEVPLSLLGICRAWNTLALSTPALWTRLDIDFAHLDEQEELNAAEKLEGFIRTWFSRGRSLPLSFHFTGKLARMNEILHDHAAYLSDLHLYITEDCLLSLRGGATFPMLRDLEIEDLYMTAGSDTILDSDVFHNAPHLRILRLIDVPPSLFTFPWSQLTKFVGIGIDVAECLSMLRKGSSLREVEFGRGDDSPSEPPLLHPSLLSLTLWQTPLIIHFLRLPALNTLHMRDIPELLDDTVVLPFLASIALRTFTFGENTPTVSLHWLHRMQQLTTLELCTSLWAHKDELLLALNRANEPQFLPQLRNLALQECEPEEINERLLDSLHTRAAPAEGGLASLQTFRLVWPQDPVRSRSCIHTDKLRELVALGLTIHVGTSEQKLRGGSGRLGFLSFQDPFAARILLFWSDRTNFFLVTYISRNTLLADRFSQPTGEKYSCNSRTRYSSASIAMT
ncbi:hypothetical protein C8J57DRAFT_1126825 [Mycena rebaudengoi]|nr:hypothetical protein C8J57DRAFT_1126825 [Mycena rebaudengoi]